MHPRLADDDLERPLRRERRGAAEGQVHAARRREPLVASAAKDLDEEGLLPFTEPRTGESGNDELRQGTICRCALLDQRVPVAVQRVQEVTQQLDRSVEHHLTLGKQDMVVRVPWVLVQGADPALVDTNESARSVRRLISGQQHILWATEGGRLTRCGVSTCLVTMTTSSGCRKPAKQLDATVG